MGIQKSLVSYATLLLNNLVSALQTTLSTLRESKTSELDFLLIMESHVGEILECFPEYPEGIREGIEVLYDEYLALKNGTVPPVSPWEFFDRDCANVLKGLR